MNESIGVFTFEGGKGVSLTKGMLKMYDDLGFSCYSTSRAGLFKVRHRIELSDARYICV